MSIFRKNTEENNESILSKLMKPSEMRIAPDFAYIQGQYNCILMAVGYPREVTEGFMDKIIQSRTAFDLSIHISPSSIDTMIVSLNQLLRKMNADKYSAEKKGVYTPSLDLLIQDTKGLLNEIQAGREKLFKTSLYVNVKDTDKSSLDASTQLVESTLNSMLIIPKKPVFKMREGLESVMPIAEDRLGQHRTLTTSALSACFPFTSNFFETSDEGILIGVDKNTGIPVLRDMFKMANPNSLVLGTSGSGKSYFCKLALLRHYITGKKVFVIDPQAEYVSLITALDGQVVEISRDLETSINIMDLMGQNQKEKRLSLVSIFQIMFPSIDNSSLSILDKAAASVYDNLSRKIPVLEDLFFALQAIKKKQKTATAIEKTDNLLVQLEQYVSGAYSFMNKETKMDFNADIICFNTKNTPEPIKPLVSYLIMEHLYNKMQKDRSKKILAVDEAWSLLKRTQSSEYLFRIVKTCRKFNMALFLITQETADLLDNEAGKAVLANTSCKLVFRQDSTVLEGVIGLLKLSEEERDILSKSTIGECLLIMDSEHVPIQVIASQKEHELITQNTEKID